MSNIGVKCVDQNLTFTNAPLIYSGDVNTDTITFDFCDVWDGYTKTAVFYKNINEPYFVLLVDNACVIPSEVMETSGRMYVGVIGVLGDKVITSEVLEYDVGQGAVTPVGTVPSPDIWKQILKLANEMQETSKQMEVEHDEFIRVANLTVDEAQTATQQCLDAISSLQLEIYDMNGGDPMAEVSDDDFDVNGGYPV